MYVCNCNGIREREARMAIERGARRPADVFRHCGRSPRCGRCVCDVRAMISQSEAALRIAAE